MKAARSVSQIILLAVLVFYSLQCLYYTSITLIYKIALFYLYLYLAVSAAYHLLFYLALLLVRKEFNLETTGETLRRINLPLILSFLRFSSIPTVLFLFLIISWISVPAVLVPFVAMIFLTDLLDGFLARKLNQTTRIGRILDASGDYLLILVISIVYIIHRWIPIWLLILVLIRLITQCAGIITLYAIRGYSSLKLSFFGKASVFAVFFLYGFELLEYLQVPMLGSTALIKVLEYTAGLILLVSLGEKVVFLGRGFLSLLRREAEARKASPGGS